MRFATVNLALNISAYKAGPIKSGPGDDESGCNPGGSYICTTGTKGCGAAALTCVGTSSSQDCAASSDIERLNFDARILVAEQELQGLRAELQKVVNSYGGRRG